METWDLQSVPVTRGCAGPSTSTVEFQTWCLCILKIYARLWQSPNLVLRLIQFLIHFRKFLNHGNTVSRALQFSPFYCTEKDFRKELAAFSLSNTSLWNLRHAASSHFGTYACGQDFHFGLRNHKDLFLYLVGPMDKTQGSVSTIEHEILHVWTISPMWWWTATQKYFCYINFPAWIFWRDFCSETFQNIYLWPWHLRCSTLLPTSSNSTPAWSPSPTPLFFSEVWRWWKNFSAVLGQLYVH